MVKITGKREFLFYVTQFYHLSNFTDKKFHEINKNASQIELIKSWEQHITSKFALMIQIQQINEKFALAFSPLQTFWTINLNNYLIPPKETGNWNDTNLSSRRCSTLQSETGISVSILDLTKRKSSKSKGEKKKKPPPRISRTRHWSRRIRGKRGSDLTPTKWNHRVKRKR